MKFWKKALILLFSAVTIGSCEKIDLFSNTKEFDVKKGNHNYFGPQIPLAGGNSIHYEVYIPDSQIHPPYKRKECNGDWNKLFGMSARLLESHLENSARFVFRPLYSKHKIEIGHYTYHDGKIIKNKWKEEIEANRYYDYEIKFEKGLAKYFFQGKLVREDTIGRTDGVKQFLQPYQGGDCGAYRDTYIVLRRVR